MVIPPGTGNPSLLHVHFLPFLLQLNKATTKKLNKKSPSKIFLWSLRPHASPVVGMHLMPGQRRSTCSVVQGEKISMYPNVESGIFKINNIRYGHKFTTDELINMSWYIQVEYCSAVKENIILAIETTWISLEIIMLKEINQTHKNKYYIWYCFSEELKTRTN